MLTKTESKVMDAVFSRCEGKVSELISPVDLCRMAGGSVSLSNLENTLSALSQDGYFDMIYSDRHGETVYCITLTEKGKAHKRNKKVFKRNLIFRLGLTIVLAIVSFVIGIILKAVFK